MISSTQTPIKQRKKSKEQKTIAMFDEEMSSVRIVNMSGGNICM